MGKARKVVLDSNRLGKRLRDLAVGGYKLRQDIIVCNIENHLGYNNLNVCCIKEDFKYPIERIEMYFYNMSSAKRLLIESVSGNCKIVLEDIEYSKDFVECNEKYNLFDGDEIPECVGDDRLVSFKLCLGKPIMYELLNMYDLLLDNNFYWDVFNNYEFLSNSITESTTTLSLDRKFSSEINVLLVNNGFTLKDNYLYESRDGESVVQLKFMGSTFSVNYSDMFSGLNGLNIDNLSEEFSEELIIGDFAKNVLPKPKFNSVMLNGNINNAEFNLSDIDLELVLQELSRYDYCLDNLGIACVSSMEWCRVVCGFRSSNSYLYIQFYFDRMDCQYKVRLLSKDSKECKLDCEGVRVTLIDVNCSDEDMTTLIKGFDFGNFKKYSLI